MLVSVIVPTRHRPGPLARALASLEAQILPSDVAMEVIVVDNSQRGEIAGAVHEPRAGVARARNAGLARARGRWIAFLDDDEEASPGWLAGLLCVAHRTGADAVFGPVIARAESGEIGPFARYFSRALPLDDGADVTALSAYLGTNNSLFRASLLEGGATFDVALDSTGGEDSLLLERLRRRGARFAYAASAPVIEWTSAQRLTWAYVGRRKFASGQIRVLVQAKAAPRRPERIAFWMAAGAAQAIGAGAAALALAPFSRERALRGRAAALGGLGKLFWARGLRPALYGEGHVP
jgi:glycosyltransferase involved in cell wall biosynthesis